MDAAAGIFPSSPFRYTLRRSDLTRLEPMSELPRHRRRPRRARRYVAAPIAAAALAGLAAVPAFLPGGGEDLVVRMDEARKAATAAGKAAALRPAIVDRDQRPSTNTPAPSPVAAGPAADGSATPTLTSETPQDSQGSSEAAEREREAAPTEGTKSASPSRSSVTPSKTTSSPTESARESEPASSAPVVTRAPEQSPSTTQAGRSTQSSSGENAAEAEVLDIVNAERASAGCGPVAHDSGLARLAGDYSADMAARGFFSHTDPDGRDPWDRARAAGIDYLRAENIARGQPTSAAVMSSWMDSPGHRANIVNCEYTKLGVGVHFASGGPWWTQSFGV
jgi:uncharacterized protein YkwD